ncbi:PREDICTED: 2'-5'-oligoadenylate synthase 1A-like [Condylura cristata]|uniref:2'-5'-oligoadenylate synthase 1A-like n=1 Tax=Condylura cristata TaxID=143302 RepID=UPI000643DE6F|nr:PREDICTED: 2'-5'-oligoadenylate synthase 1A-like [Condylura cristata]
MWALQSYSCEHCGSDFISDRALKYHIRQKHLGKVHCEKWGQEVLREKLQDHSKSVHDSSTVVTHKLNGENLEERNMKHTAKKISKTCRMCSRHFGTVLGREKHEIQEHHFTASKRAQMSTGFSPHNMLECKNSQELQRFADEKIRPSPGPLSAACAAEVSAVLQLIQACFPVPASRVIQGGSFIKGTDTKGYSEIDVVLFSDVFANVNLCKKQLKEGLDALRKNLKQTSYGNRSGILMGKRASLSLRFNFLCSGNLHSHSFEIMTYYDILGPKPSTGEIAPLAGAAAIADSALFGRAISNFGSNSHQKDLKLHLYRKLYLCDDSDEAQLCALALLPYQVAFVKASITRVKELIRLMIHWFRTSFAKPTEENKFRRLPSTYTVELLTIHVWELAGKPLFFSLVQGMRAILKLLVQYAEIDVVWHRHYHPKFPIFVKVNQKRTRPFILDPVNPTANLCDSCNAWDEVAHVARCSLEKPLFNRVRVRAPWLFTNKW